MNKAQKEAQRIKPFLTSNIPARQSTNSSPQNSTIVTSGGGVDNTAAINAVASDLALHKLLDYAEGHGPADIYRSKQHTYHSNKFGIVGGTGTDESNNIIAMLNTVGLGGGGVCVISATNYADPVIQIDKTISIYYDNVRVVFDPATRVLMGATGCLRIMGSLDEYTRKVDLTAMKLHVASTVNGSSQTVLELSAADTALMDAEAVPANRIVVVGDKIVVRGQNDVSGKAIEKDTTFVSSLAKVGSYWRITCVDELDYTFQPTYPSSEWPPDLTTGTTIYIVRYATIGSDLPAGSVSAVVNTVTGFSVGDVIQVGDARTENAYNASAIKGSGLPYANPAALEMLRIIAINIGTLTISFDRATTRTYKAGSPYYGGVARTVMVRSSGIMGARISYHAAQASTSYNPLQMTYAVECEIHHNLVNGFTYIDGTADYGRASHALRISYALNCKAYNNVILDCLLSGSGQGYGITDYYATGSEIYSNTISGCRHNILLQLSTNCLIHDNESRNHLISGIDVHGVNSYGFHIYDNTITQANGSTADSTQASGIRIGNTSHSVGDHYGVVENNLFIYTSGTSDQAMDVIANSSNITFRNNTIYNANIGFKFTLNSKQITPVQTATNILVEGNRFVACTAGCISVTAAPTYDNVNSNGKLDKFAMIGNISDGNDKHFQMTGVVTTLGLSNVLVMDNIIVNPTNVITTNYGVSIKYTSGYVHIYNNNVSGAQRGITVLGCGTVYVVGNKTASTVQTDPFTDGGGNSFLSYIDAMSTGGGGGSSAFATNVSVTNAAPEYIWVESGYTANNTTWDIVVDAGVMHFRLVNDAFSAAADWMTVTRSANTATAISIAATALNLSGALSLIGNATVDGIVYARQPGSTRYYAGMYAASGTGGLSAYDTTGAVNIPLYIDGSIIYLRTGTALTHTHTFDASGNVTLTGALTVTSAAPDYLWIETGFTANNLAWDIVVDAGVMHYRLLNDALSSATDWMTIVRSANTATAINIAATALGLAGALTQTGNVTLAGNIAQSGSSGAGAVTSSVLDTATPTGSSTGPIFTLGFAGASAGKYTVAGDILARLVWQGAGNDSPYAYNAAEIRSVIQTGGNTSRSNQVANIEFWTKAAGSVSPVKTGEITAGAMLVSPDTDTTHIFGRTVIGYSSSIGSDFAYFSHYDQRASNPGYALLQTSAGETYVNGVGNLHLRISNADVGLITSSGLTVTGTLAVTGDFGAWTAVTFATNWANKGSTWTQCAYRKIGDIVQIKGIVKYTPGTAITATDTIFTLPSGYRPAKNALFVTRADNGMGHVQIYTTGIVNIEYLDSPSTASSYLILDNIQFSIL